MSTATETHSDRIANTQAAEIKYLETLLTTGADLFTCQTCSEDIRYGCSDYCTETVRSEELTPELEAWLLDTFDEDSAQNLDGMPTIYDYGRINGLDFYVEGKNRGNGWEITTATLITGLGGPNVWVETDGSIITVGVAWWSENATVMILDCPTVAAELLEYLTSCTQLD